MIFSGGSLEKPHVEIYNFTDNFVRKPAYENQITLAVFLRNH